MKILMLNYEFPPIGGGGGQANAAILRQYAGKSDLRVDVLTSAQSPGFSEEKISDNVTVYKVGVHKKNLHYWRKIEVIEWLMKARRQYQKMLDQTRYDLVHAFFGLPTGWLCYKTAERIPYIISLRGSDVPGGHARLQLEYKILAPLLRKIWTKASALVANSEGLRQRALRFMPTAAIEVIPNGVDLNQYTPSQANDITGEIKLLTVGRLSVTKRVEILIETVEILSKNKRKASLTIAGGGAMLDGLKRLAEQKGLSNTIEFTGRIESGKMPEIYRTSNIFVSATMQEGMSNAMLEAMASGLPIITTPCEGLEELIADNGIIVKDSSVQSLAEAISKLAEDKHRFKAMCESARRRAEKFGWDSVAESYIQLYERIIQKVK